jgi:tetratricopeptide (TPR) repeat protein
MRISPGSRSKLLTAGLILVLALAFPFYSGYKLAATEPSTQTAPSQESDAPPQSADKLLDAGNAFYAAGDMEQAKKSWLEVRSRSQTLPAWPKAVHNLGILEREQGHYVEAISYFSEILQSHPNDTEPGESIMQVYRNYSHRSALQISLCYEKMWQNRKALHYARLAKTQYPYLSWCGTCLASERFAVNTRIGYLALKAYGIPVILVAGLAGFVVRKRFTPHKQPLTTIPSS